MLTGLTEISVFGPPLRIAEIGWNALEASARERLRSHHACLIRGFPIDVDRYVDFLDRFGDTLTNYGQGAQLPPYSLHPKVNRVQYTERQSEDKYVHERGGPLRPHSARSWRDPRPSYFCMLMVDPGWIGNEAGSNGESIVVSWREVLGQLRDDNSATFARDYRLLSETPIDFKADHVVEPTSQLALLYRLADSEDELDLGARVRGDFRSTAAALTSCLAAMPDRDRYLEALARFLRAADDKRACACYQMARGDLVMLDNDRFGHGRRAIVAAREEAGQRRLNPRELWSVSVA